MQGVQSDHRAADIDLLQQGPDGRNLAPLFGVGVAGDGHRVVVANQRHGFVTVRGESPASTETGAAPAGQGALREHTGSM